MAEAANGGGELHTAKTSEKRTEQLSARYQHVAQKRRWPPICDHGVTLTSLDPENAEKKILYGTWRGSALEPHATIPPPSEP